MRDLDTECHDLREEASVCCRGVAQRRIMYKGERALQHIISLGHKKLRLRARRQLKSKELSLLARHQARHLRSVGRSVRDRRANIKGAYLASAVSLSV